MTELPTCKWSGTTLEYSCLDNEPCCNSKDCAAVEVELTDRFLFISGLRRQYWELAKEYLKLTTRILMIDKDKYMEELISTPKDFKVWRQRFWKWLQEQCTLALEMEKILGLE
jgi:hypothetical protein